MSEKRYYWLKLMDDFFTSKRIKRLRSMAGGDTYTIIYLKMQLKALKTDGYLYYDGIMDDFADELALDLDEKEDDVRITINYLLSVGLMEMGESEKEYKLTYMEKLIGSESASTQRVRDFREREKEKEKLSGDIKKPEPQNNALRQKMFRAKEKCNQKQHIPMIEDYMNNKRYSGNYYLVIQRDKYQCALCGSIENLCVHHIDGYDEEKPQNNSVNKMLTLCRCCHSNVHSGVPIPEDILDSIDYYSNEMLPGNKDVTQVKRVGNAEKEIEIDIEIDKEKDIKRKPENQIPPTLEMVTAYCEERKNGIDAQLFIDFYEANGWMVGKNKMKNWHAAVRTWEQRDKAEKEKKTASQKKPEIKKSQYDFAALQKMAEDG